MKKYVMPKADARNPWMGLNGIVCTSPAYWCRLHEVWLSKDDVARKRCMARLTIDMRGTYRCFDIEERSNPWVHDGEVI